MMRIHHTGRKDRKDFQAFLLSSHHRAFWHTLLFELGVITGFGVRRGDRLVCVIRKENDVITFCNVFLLKIFPQAVRRDYRNETML